MKNEHGFWVSGLTPERHLENVVKALGEGKTEVALFDLRELEILLEKEKIK